MTRYLLSLAVVAAVALAAACDGTSNELSNGLGGDPDSPAAKKKGGKGGVINDPADDEAPTGDDGLPTGPVPTNSPGGKEFFKANVHPFMATACGSCHQAAGPGPNWITTADAEKSYAQLFQVGYVVQQSRIIMKPAHGGLTNNVLTAAQQTTYNQWVSMELKDGGGKAPPNVLAKLGACFSRQKFDAMQLGGMRTTRRTNNNNTNNVTPWNENANNCTGCDNAPCTTCHSADPATNYNNAVGNTLLPAETTFENSKMTAPAYITKYFGVSAEGKPIASDALKKKSDSTKKDKAYSHPMYTLNAQQQAALDAFVADAIATYTAKNGECGAATPAPTQ